MKKVLIPILILVAFGCSETRQTVAEQAIVLQLTEDTTRESREDIATHQVVVIDPGHGTKNSSRGTKGEAALNLIIACKVYSLLVKEPGITPILTHNLIGVDLGAKCPTEDNINRAQIANKKKAALFLRLHCDSPSGARAVYYPRLHPDKEVAEKSRFYAEIFNKHLSHLPAQGRNSGVRGDEATAVGSRNGGLLVGSRASNVPTVLIEMLPLNTANRLWLDHPANQEMLAMAIANATVNALRSKNVASTNFVEAGLLQHSPLLQLRT